MKIKPQKAEIIDGNLKSKKLKVEIVLSTKNYRTANIALALWGVKWNYRYARCFRSSVNTQILHTCAPYNNQKLGVNMQKSYLKKTVEGI